MSQYPTFSDFLNGVRNASPHERNRAVHTVARHANDTGDLTTLMDMLGLTADDIHPAPAELPAPTAEHHPRAVQKRLQRGYKRLR